MKKRYHFIDDVKGIAIISVVLVHLFATVSSIDPSVDLKAAVGFMSNYDLAVFFVVSGFLLGERTESAPMGLRTFLSKRAKKRMIVYGVMSMIYLLGDFTRVNVMYSVTGFGISVLWFLPALVLSELFFLIVSKIKVIWVQAIISAALAALSWFLGGMVQPLWESESFLLHTVSCILILFLRAMVGQLFVEIGFLLHKLLKHMSRWQRIAGTVICLAAGIAGCLQEKNSDWRTMSISKPVIWFVAAITMSVGLMLLFHELEFIRIRLLEEIGKESLLIMCTHMYFGTMSQSVALGYRISGKCTHAKTYIFWGTIIVAMAVMETLFILIKRHGYKY